MTDTSWPVPAATPFANKRPPKCLNNEAVQQVLKLYESTWKKGSCTAVFWPGSLRDYAIPSLGIDRVCDIQTDDVMAVMLPIWTEKPETAQRVQQRISSVMKWVIAQGFCQDDSAGEAISATLPSHTSQRQYRQGLSHSRVPSAIDRIRSANCVLLVPRCLEILTQAHLIRNGSGIILLSARNKNLHTASLSEALRQLEIPAVPRGFRSSFRNWCAESIIACESVEASLTHVVPGIEGAYLRSHCADRASLRIGRRQYSELYFAIGARPWSLATAARSAALETTQARAN